MRKEKKLRMMKEAYYGQVAEDGTVCVNVQMIWHILEDEALFIAEFAKTFCHELLHVEIAKAHDFKEIGTEVGEERLIRCMLDEPWDKELEEMYLEVV